MDLNEAVKKIGRGLYNLDTMPPDMRNFIVSSIMKGSGKSEEEIVGRLKQALYHEAPLLTTNRAMLRVFTDENYSVEIDDMILSKIKTRLESYDRQRDIQILQEKNIVEAYNRFINDEFDRTYQLLNALNTEFETYGLTDELAAKATRLVTEENMNRITVLIQNMHRLITKYNLDESTAIKYVKESTFPPLDNPEEIKALLEARLQYDDSMISILKAMLQNSYSILGLSRDEALVFSKKLDSTDEKEKRYTIRQIKDIIVKNEDKFVTKNRIDLRPLGGGVLFVTDEETGLEAFFNLDRLIQKLMEYDCIVLGHGNVNNRVMNAIERELTKTAYSDDTVEDRELTIEDISRYARKNKDKAVWTIQPTRTLTGGPFTDVNELVRQLIKEGFKNIQLNSCNPGHVKLAPDIVKNREVTVTYSENTLLAENVSTPNDPYYEINETIANIEQTLIETCSDLDLYYGDDENLCEAAMHLYRTDLNLSEGVGSNIWEGVKKVVKSIIAAIVFIIKKFIELIKSMIRKVKEFFNKLRNKLKEKKSSTKTEQKVKIISLQINDNGANMTEKYTDDINDIEKELKKSSEQITKIIDKLAKDTNTTKNQYMKMIQENERKDLSQNPQNEAMDQLMNLLF